MSIRLEPDEFSRACLRVMRSCAPADYHAQHAWLSDWFAAAERMRYLQVHQIGITDSLRTLIRIRGSLKKPNLALEFIQPDVATLWSKMAAKADEAAHTFYKFETGFECCFLAVVKNTYITGSFVVNRHSPKEESE